MRLWEEFSGIIFKALAKPYLKTFSEKVPEKILRKSLEVIDPDVQVTLKEYVRNCQSASGGFKDRAGRPDIYYTLFGYYLAEALNLNDLLPGIRDYVVNEIHNNKIGGVHLHCAAILFSKLGSDIKLRDELRKQIKKQLSEKGGNQPAYRAFVSLLACYYLNDFRSLYIIKNQLEKLEHGSKMPSPVVAALVVLHHCFGKNTGGLIQELLSFVSASSPPATLHGGAQEVPPGGFRGEFNGGFKAVRTAPVPDLLSTAVSLYALRFAGYEMRVIKPGCLGFIDLLYREGGFSASLLDPEPDIEYTFYGFLALGSLAD